MSNRSERRAAILRIEVLRAELTTCTTVAMRRSVQESLTDAERQLERVSGVVPPRD
jgi:hypothetical protein